MADKTGTVEERLKQLKLTAVVDLKRGPRLVISTALQLCFGEQELQLISSISVCLEYIRAMRPTSSDAKLWEEVGRDRVDRCILFCQRPFVVPMLRRLGVSIYTFTLSVDIVNTGYCVSVHFRKHSVIW